MQTERLSEYEIRNRAARIAHALRRPKYKVDRIGGRLLACAYAKARKRFMERECLWPEHLAEDSAEAAYEFVGECIEARNLSGVPTVFGRLPETREPWIRTVVEVWFKSSKGKQLLKVESHRLDYVYWVLRACELWRIGRRREHGAIVSPPDLPPLPVWTISLIYGHLAKFRKRLHLPAPSEYWRPRDFQLSNGSTIDQLNPAVPIDSPGISWITFQDFREFPNRQEMLQEVQRQHSLGRDTTMVYAPAPK